MLRLYVPNYYTFKMNGELIFRVFLKIIRDQELRADLTPCLTMVSTQVAAQTSYAEWPANFYIDMQTGSVALRY